MWECLTSEAVREVHPPAPISSIHGLLVLRDTRATVSRLQIIWSLVLSFAPGSSWRLPVAGGTANVLNLCGTFSLTHLLSLSRFTSSALFWASPLPSSCLLGVSSSIFMLVSSTVFDSAVLALFVTFARLVGCSIRTAATITEYRCFVCALELCFRSVFHLLLRFFFFVFRFFFLAATFCTLSSVKPPCAPVASICCSVCPLPYRPRCSSSQRPSPKPVLPPSWQAPFGHWPSELGGFVLCKVAPPIAFAVASARSSVPSLVFH